MGKKTKKSLSSPTSPVNGDTWMSLVFQFGALANYIHPPTWLSFSTRSTHRTKKPFGKKPLWGKKPSVGKKTKFFYVVFAYICFKTYKNA